MKKKDLTEKDYKIIIEEASERTGAGPLIKAIAEHVGFDEHKEIVEMFTEIARGGSSSDYPGFMSCNKTSDFFDKHNEEIIKLLKWEMQGVTDFNDVTLYLKCVPEFTSYDLSIISCIINGTDCTHENTKQVMDIKESLVWFTLDILSYVIKDEYDCYLLGL